jgi:heme/copper-type cytochrome/quinol oxidase subunit 2
LCGLGHYNMKAYLNVMSQEDYDKWQKEQSAQ